VGLFLQIVAFLPQKTILIADVRIYGYRFKIEVSFKQALHTLGTYAYHV
jgi:hypothetical protein